MARGSTIVPVRLSHYRADNPVRKRTCDVGYRTDNLGRNLRLLWILTFCSWQVCFDVFPGKVDSQNKAEPAFYSPPRYPAPLLIR
jgi:hypothetical protein